MSEERKEGSLMEIEIKELSPDLAEDYARFFDTTPHNNTGKGTKCYCVTWCSDPVYHSGGEHWYPSEEERRLHGLKRVKDGSIRGYLAYCGDEIVGWCNVNTKADCQEAMKYFRSMGIPIDECRAGEKSKFVFCFAIAPKAQSMGVATKLLAHACQDAADNGFDFIEALPYRELADDGFRGPLALYEKCGFSIQAEHEGKVVVRKVLNHATRETGVPASLTP